MRREIEPTLDWPLVWGAYLALPSRTLHEHGLLFDEEFGGWGAQDQEWGLRVQRAGIPIVRSESAQGLHLPHARDAAGNHATYYRNSRRLLRKWPCLEAEAARCFGWRGSNERYPELRRQLAQAVPAGAAALGAVRGVQGGVSVLYLGVPLDERGRGDIRGRTRAAGGCCADRGASVAGPRLAVRGPFRGALPR